MAIVAGAQGTGGTQGIFASRRKVAMKDGLSELEPNINPLTLILRKVSKRTITDPKPQWLEHDRFGDTTTADGTYTNVATTISVADGTVGAPNMLVRNQRTDEVIRIGTLNGNDWEGCTRSVGDTAAAAGADGDYFTILGTSFAENSAAPTPRAKDETLGYNFTQIFRDTFGASGTLVATDLYGTGKQILSERAAQRAHDHNVYMEKSMLFGERSEVTAGTMPIRSMGGIDEFISQTHDFGGTFSMQAGFDALEVGMRYGSPSKLLVCSRGAASNISLEALDKVRNTSSEKTFGINISVLESPHGRVNIVRHDMLVGNQYGKRAYLLDIKNLSYLCLKGRDTALYEGLEDNGTDGEIHGWLTECTLERMHAETHQTWLNVNS